VAQFATVEIDCYPDGLAIVVLASINIGTTCRPGLPSSQIRISTRSLPLIVLFRPDPFGLRCQNSMRVFPSLRVKIDSALLRDVQFEFDTISSK